MKSFDQIMSSFQKTKDELTEFINHKTDAKRQATEAAKEQLLIASDCALDIKKANKAIKAVNKFIG